MTPPAPPRKPRAKAAAPAKATRARASNTVPAALVDDPATAYALSVVSGEAAAGPHVRGACERHLADREAGVWTWDVEAANRVIRYFATVLVLGGGEHEGKPFVLLPWQEFVVGSLFGWKGPDGLRRFRTAYIESGKGSGKSPLAAGVGMYMLTSDSEPRAEIYAAASKLDQAQILFRDAVAMFDQSPWLNARLKPTGGKGKEWNLAHVKSSSWFRTVASEDGQSGFRPHCALLDEIHEHHNDNAVKLMRAGTKGRRQALIFMITNSGHDRTGVCWNYHEYAVSICKGVKVDDAFFAYVCALDENDDPFESEACWAKANPSLGYTFGLKYIRELVTQARGMPSSEAVVRRLNFCQWTDAESPWIDVDLWNKCESDFDPADLAHLPCYGGLDLSQKRDLTAFTATWVHLDGRKSSASWFWTPGDTLAERSRTDNVPYALWRDQKHLFAPPGRMIDKRHVATFVQKFAGANQLETLAYDQAQADDFLTACNDIGFDVWIEDREPKDDGTYDEPPGVGLRMVRHGQGWSGYNSKKTMWMNRSITALEDVIVNGQLEIQRNPVMRYCSASAVIEADASNNRKWNKQKATGRMDGMISLSESVGAASIGAPPARVSIWDRPELFNEFDTP